MRLVLVFLLLSGCTTTIGEMRANHQPRATYQSAKSSDELGQCIAERLSWAGTPSVIRGEDSTQIAIMATGGATIMVTLVPAATGQTVEVRQLLTYSPRVRKNVESCV